MPLRVWVTSGQMFFAYASESHLQLTISELEVKGVALQEESGAGLSAEETF